MNVARVLAGSVVYKGKIYVIGNYGVLTNPHIFSKPIFFLNF